MSAMAGRSGRVAVLAVACVLLAVGCGGDEPVSPAGEPAAASRTIADEIPSGRDAVIERVVDGDTLVVEGGERVRLIGVDTPETVHPSRDVECYGPEASAFTERLIPEGSEVRLVFDVERTDRYDRTLAYVYRLEDGLFVNAELVAEGYAQVATYPPNVAHTDDFVALQREAREDDRGLWDACEGAEEPPAAASADGPCDPAYPDLCLPSPPPTLNCADLEDRNIRVLPPDPHGLDGDGDGVGCER